MNPIDFGGQKSKVKVTVDKSEYSIVNTMEFKTVILIKLFMNVAQESRVNPIYFLGLKCKVRVTIW